MFAQSHGYHINNTESVTYFGRPLTTDLPWPPAMNQLVKLSCQSMHRRQVRLEWLANMGGAIFFCGWTETELPYIGYSTVYQGAKSRLMNAPYSWDRRRRFYKGEIARPVPRYTCALFEKRDELPRATQLRLHMPCGVARWLNVAYPKEARPRSID